MSDDLYGDDILLWCEQQAKALTSGPVRRRCRRQRSVLTLAELLAEPPETGQGAP